MTHTLILMALAALGAAIVVEAVRNKPSLTAARPIGDRGEAASKLQEARP